MYSRLDAAPTACFGTALLRLRREEKSTVTRAGAEIAGDGLRRYLEHSPPYCRQRDNSLKKRQQIPPSFVRETLGLASFVGHLSGDFCSISFAIFVCWDVVVVNCAPVCGGLHSASVP